MPGLGVLLVALAMQVGVNYANDYSDWVRGADTAGRVGPLRAASSGLVPAHRVRLAALVSFGVAAAAGLAVSLVTDWRLLALGAAAIAAGWLYTGGPRPYGYLGLGELFVFVFFGLVATAGTVYVHEHRVPPAAWVAAFATGSLACAILALNNLRDIGSDAQVGKRTLAVRLGPHLTRALVSALLVGALLAPLVAVAGGWAPLAASLPLLSAVLLPGILRRTASSDPRSLIGALKWVGGLEVCWALLWALGLVVAA